VLGVVNFTSFHAAMDSGAAHRQAGPHAVELVDRTMIELARANPAFRPTIEHGADRPPEAILLVEFAATTSALLRAAARLVELMGDLGLPGSVVEMPDDAPQKALWEVRKAGLNIMMSLKGDGKPVSFIEDCAVPLRAPGRVHRRADRGVRAHGTRGTWYAHASVGTLHVRPILDMRHATARARRCAPSPRKPPRWCASTRAPTAASMATACAAASGSLAVRPEDQRRLRAIKDLLDPAGLFNPGKIVDPPKMDDARAVPLPPAPGTIELKPVLDWSAWNVQNDPVTESHHRAGHRRRPTGGFAKAVEMCNNNGHCRKFDAGTMCPSYRVTRDEQHLTRGRANTLRLALSGQLGPDALHQRRGGRRDGPVRRLQGLQARLPDRRRHGAHEDRVHRAAQARHGHTLRDRWSPTCPTTRTLAEPLCPGC
jgi:hypothetical protein